VWKFATSGFVWSSPAIDAAGDVYVGSYDYNVYCIDGTTGNQRWVFSTSGPVQSSPAIGPNGVLYIGSSDNNVYALHGST
jgi:outer membrane protein assembly factor BamB